MNIGIWAPLGPFGTLGPYLFVVFWTPWALLGPLDPIMSDFYETLLFLERQEAFWKDQNDSENPEWFWCITRPVMDPLGPFGTLGPFGPFGPFGTLGPFGPFGPFGTLGP